ncbi:hypothetical protein L7F22_002112 [Adiantum nelumboides]|nr:hypothetical protein [Adiantum nelumboides]
MKGPVPEFQNNSQLPGVNVPIYAEEWETVNGVGRDPLRRIFAEEALQHMAGVQIGHRIKRQNCGNNVPLHQNSMFGSRDQVGSRFAFENSEPGGTMSYPPRASSPSFHGLTGEGNRALIDRTFPPTEAESSSSFGFQPSNGNFLRSSVSERQILHYPVSDSLGNYTGSPCTHSCSGSRSACKRKSAMDAVIGSVGSSTFRPISEQRRSEFSWFTKEASTSKAEPAILPLSPDLVSMRRIPVLNDSSHPRENTLLSQPSRARSLERLHVGSNRYYGGYSNRPQEVYQTFFVENGRMSHTWISGGALANEYMMPSARNLHETSSTNHNLSATVVPWCSNGFVSGESSMNQSYVHRDFNTGLSREFQVRNFPNGGLLRMGDPYETRYTFEPSSRDFPGYSYRGPTSQRSFRLPIVPMYSGRIPSWHSPALPLISHNGFNGQGGLLPYHRAATDNMILGPPGAPESVYSPFMPLNRSAIMLPFRQPAESVGASSIHSHYRMPFQGLETLPAHRGSGHRLPSHDSFDHALAYDGFEVEGHHYGLQPDVDNMSYEELLALEERIGNVNTGLSEENICKCLKTSKHSSYDMPVLVAVPQESEIKCSICQEDYMAGDELGQLNCSHTYHTGCIKQWLGLKNQCPICKAPALS